MEEKMKAMRLMKRKELLQKQLHGSQKHRYNSYGTDMAGVYIGELADDFIGALTEAPVYSIYATFNVSSSTETGGNSVIINANYDKVESHKGRLLKKFHHLSESFAVNFVGGIESETKTLTHAFQRAKFNKHLNPKSINIYTETKPATVTLVTPQEMEYPAVFTLLS